MCPRCWLLSLAMARGLSSAWISNKGLTGRPIQGELGLTSPVNTETIGFNGPPAV